MTLEAEFHQAMMEVYEVAKDHDYNAAYFKRMIDEHGGVEAAKRLLAKREIQSGLVRLWELGLLNSSMEAAVLQERFSVLFTEAEVQEARQRLEQLDFFRGSS